MTRRLASLILCGAVLGSACATKSFVQEQVSATESKLAERAALQETKLRETADRTGESRQAIDVADQRLNGLDLRVGEVGTRVSSARDAEARLSQRLASRNRHRLLDTKFVYFESGQTEIRSQDFNELEDVAKALRADPNAILELQGF